MSKILLPFCLFERAHLNRERKTKASWDSREREKRLKALEKTVTAMALALVPTGDEE
jgi:hypothetical protein